MSTESYRLSIQLKLKVEINNEITDVWFEDKWNFQFYCSERGCDFFPFLVAHWEDDGVKEFFVCDRYSYRHKAFASLIDSFNYEPLIDARIKQDKDNHSYNIPDQL